MKSMHTTHAKYNLAHDLTRSEPFMALCGVRAALMIFGGTVGVIQSGGKATIPKLYYSQP